VKIIHRPPAITPASALPTLLAASSRKVPLFVEPLGCPNAKKIATLRAVELPDLLEFIRPRHRMVLTTFRADGSLQSSPVTGGVDAAGRVVVASYPQRAKSINIRRTAKASVVVLSDEFNGAYVQLDGDAEVIDAPEAVEPL